MGTPVEQYRKMLAKSSGGKVAASEHDLQTTCVNWFRYTYPQYARLLMAIPNGGQRNSIVAAKMKAEGVQAGVPDLFLAVGKHKFHGLWIEMKNGKAGQVSDKQTEMMQLLWQQGYDCRIARSILDFEEIIKQYLT